MAESALELVYITVVVFIGAAAQAAIGMGLNLFAIPLLALVNPIYAPGPILVASMLLCALALWKVPAEIEWKELRLSIAGLAIGTLVAGAIVLMLEGDALKRVLGACVVLGAMLAMSGWAVPITRASLLAAGGGSGVLGTIAGVHAPPIALLYQGQSPGRVRGAVLPFIGIGAALSIPTLFAVGLFGREQMIATLHLIPGVLMGVWFAPRIAKLISARLLRVLILSISAISGLVLVLGG